MDMSLEPNERLMRLETKLDEHCINQDKQLGDIKSAIEKIDNKLDVKLESISENKADKSELTKLDAKFWAVVMGIVALAIKIIFDGK